MKFKFIIILPVFALLMISCIQHRTWSSPVHKHLYYEVEIKNNSRKSVSFSSKVTGNKLSLQFYETKYCKQIQYDVEKLSIVESTETPGAKYYMVLGGVIMSLALPNYYLGINTEGTPRAIHLGVGTGLFFIPGLLLGGYALYKKMENKVVTKKVGNTRREIKTKETECGKNPLKSGSTIELLTKIGYVKVGKINSKGSIIIDLKNLNAHPLYSTLKKKFYYEIYLKGSSIGNVTIPQTKSVK